MAMSDPPRSVMVAVDFGDASARAVTLGGFIAERCGAPLRLLHAETIEAPPYFTHDQIESLERQREATRMQADQFLTRFGRQHTRYPFVAAIDERPPVDAIVLESATADLVVMGTHGRHGPRRWWLGSVAERVLRSTSRPLLITRAEMSHDPRAVFTRVVVHSANLPADAVASRYADALAQCVGGAVADNDATMIVAAVPARQTGAWLSRYGEPLVRSGSLPVLFVPESREGASS
jgi:nucleotide-binding universal stress UspA family protein